MEWLDVLRYVASIGLTVAGAVALIVEFRHPTTRGLTRVGVSLLVAIISCGCLLIVVQVITDATERQHRLAQEAAQRADRQQLLALRLHLKRVELPIRTMYISYVFRADDDKNGELHAYLNRVRSKIPYLGPAIPRQQVPGIPGGIYGSQYFVCEGSLPIPDDKLEPTVLSYERIAYFPIEIFRRPVDVTRHPWTTGSSRQTPPDLEFFVNQRRRPVAACMFCGCPYVTPGLGALFVGGTVNIQREDFNGSGEIVSIPDLAGAQMLIKLPPFVSVASMPSRQQRVVYGTAFRAEIEHFRMKIAPLGEMWIPFKTYPARDGGIIHEFIFPNDFAQQAPPEKAGVKR